MPRLLAHWLASLAMASAIPGQTVALLPHEARHVHAWPEVVAAGTLQPELARLCRFRAGLPADAVLLRANMAGAGMASRELFVLRDVSRAHACVPLGPALDFVVLDCDQGAQGVLALGNEGTLRFFRWAANQPLPTVQVVGSWPGFRRLAAVRNGATTEVFGFDIASIRIRRATWSGAQLSASSLVFVPPNVTYIEGMDWNQDGVMELVLGTPATTYVQGWNFAPVTNIPWAGSNAASVTVSTCVSHSTTAGDHLVAVVFDGVQTAMSWANATTTGMMVLGSCPVGAIATFDRDGDGDEDLLLGDATHSVVHVLLREPNGYLHTVAPLLVGPCAADAGIGALAGGDLDGDGDGDVLAWSRGTLNTHSVFDASSGSQRLRGLHGDILGATIGNVVELPVTVELPVGLVETQPMATSFRLRFDGWLVDPISGLVQPQRVVSHEVLIDPNQSTVATTVAFALPATGLQRFHLQLVAGVVAILDAGERRPLPATLVHMTNDPAREAAIQNTVAVELTGNQHGKGGGDGGGDGNILGTKTGKHQIGAPPE